MYVPQFFVSSQQRFGATDIKALGASQLSGLGQTVCVIALRQISVTALFYLEDSRRIHPRSMRACQPKDLKRREWEGEREKVCTHAGEKERETRFGFSFCMFFSCTWACPMQIELSQECCLFHLKSSLWSLDLLLFYFCRLFPSLSFRHHHSTLLFPILTNNLKCRKQFSSFQF